MTRPEETNVGLRSLLLLACVVIIIAGFREAGTILVPILTAFFIGVICIPPVSWLQRHGIRTGLAIVIVFLVVLAGFLVLSYFVSDSISSFQKNLPKYEDALDKPLATLTTWLESHGVEVSLAQLQEQLDAGTLTDVLSSGLSALAKVLSDTLLIMLTVIFVLCEAVILPRKVRAMISDDTSDLAEYRRALSNLRVYLAVKTQLSLATGVLAGLATWIIGVDYPLLWGLLAFLLNYIPTLGSILAAIPPVLLALVQFNWTWALLVAACYLAINICIGNLIEPRMMGRRLGLSTLVVFLSMVFWGWVWGPIGMILSVPLTMLLKILLLHSDDLRWIGLLLGSGSEDDLREGQLKLGPANKEGASS
ncbi:MAG: AI-2E family transporter [Planctomycetota bacterium]|nr:AI-2E family transporter [Planctomycetota bacterium]